MDIDDYKKPISGTTFIQANASKYILKLSNPDVSGFQNLELCVFKGDELIPVLKLDMSSIYEQCTPTNIAKGISAHIAHYMHDMTCADGEELNRYYDTQEACERMRGEISKLQEVMTDAENAEHFDPSPF